DADDVIVLVENGDCLRRVLEECSEVNVLGLQCVVETLTISNVDGDPDSTGDSSVGAAKRLDAGLERSSTPICLVANELSMQRPLVRGERCEARLARFQHLVQSHADLFVGARANVMKTSALREGDVELRVGGPEVDWH